MTTSEQDSEHLRLLSVFHYIAGGLAALVSLFPILHVCIGILLMNQPGRFTLGVPSPFPIELMGMMFAILGGLIIFCGWVLAGLTLFAGRCLAKRKHHFFCMVTAALNCLFFPIGTALGVFTLIVLLRPSVRSLFT